MPRITGGSDVTITIKTVGDASGAEKIKSSLGQVSAMGDKFKKLGSRLSRAGKTLSLKVTAPLIALGTLGVKTAMDMETAWKEVSKVYDGAASDIDTLLSPAIDRLAFQFGEQKRTVVGVMAELAAMGYTGPGLIDKVTQSLEFATTGNMELERAMSGVVALTKIFGIGGEELRNKLAALNMVENVSAASMDDLVDAFTTAGNVSKVTGVSIEELSAMMAVLRERGVESGEAAMGLKTILQRLGRDTEAAEEIYGKLNIQIADASGTMRDADQVLVDLAGKWNQLTDVEKQEYVQKQIGIFQADKFLALMDDLSGDTSTYTEVLNSLTDEQENVNRYQAEMNEFLDRSAVKFGKTKIRVLELAEKIGDILLPYIESFLDKLDEWIQRFLGLDPATQNIVIGLGAVAAIIGPMLMILGPLATGFGALTTLLGSFAVGPVALGIAAIVGLFTFLDKITRNLTGIGYFEQLRSAIILLTPLVNTLFDKLSGIVNTLSGLGGGALLGPFGTILNLLGRQYGGEVTAGRPYMVGERGPEIFTPRVPGTITPNSQLATVTVGDINIYNPTVRSEEDIFAIAKAVKDALSRDAELVRMGAL